MSETDKIDLSVETISIFRKASEDAARKAGEILLKWMGKTNATEKNPGDLVTVADLESQQVLRDTLLAKFPNHFFLGEENDGSLTRLETEDFCWVVDPLDGTTNFVHQMRSFCVSVALVYRSRVIAGTVFDPVLEECYSAAVGQGATLNGQPVRVSDCEDVGRSLLVCSFRSRIPVDDPEISRFARVMNRAGAVRRLGSAALNLCYVGCGRLDGYWATSLKIWDVAAGILILKEAGGSVCHIDGREFDLRDPRMLASATFGLQTALLKILNAD